MACPMLDGCPLFALFTMKATARLWRANYCEGDHQGCERVRLQAAGQRVPPNLLPNGRLMEAPLLAPQPARRQAP